MIVITCGLSQLYVSFHRPSSLEICLIYSGTKMNWQITLQLKPFTYTHFHQEHVRNQNLYCFQLSTFKKHVGLQCKGSVKLYFTSMYFIKVFKDRFLIYYCCFYINMRSNYLIYRTVIYLLTLNSSSNNFPPLLWVLITKSINILSCQMDKGTSKTSFYILM